MDPLARRRLGRTQVEVTLLGIAAPASAACSRCCPRHRQRPPCRPPGTPASAITIPRSGCAERGIGFVIGAVFASGILATGAVQGARYAYAQAVPEMLAKVARIEGCARGMA